MDQSITERPQTEAEKLLAHHPSTKALTITATAFLPRTNCLPQFAVAR